MLDTMLFLDILLITFKDSGKGRASKRRFPEDVKRVACQSMLRINYCVMECCPPDKECHFVMTLRHTLTIPLFQVLYGTDRAGAMTGGNTSDLRVRDGSE